MTRIYQMYHAQTQATNAATYLQFPRRGSIKRISWSWRARANADNSYGDAELSFSGTAQCATDNALGPIDGVSVQYTEDAAGSTTFNGYHTCAVDIEVLPGDRLYLNEGTTNTVTLNHRIWIEVDERGGG